MNEPRSDVFVFFGATGDLGFKEIFPALFALFRRNQLGGPIIGVARSSLTASQFRQRAQDSLKAYGIYQQDEFDAFARTLVYVSGDYRDMSTFERLQKALDGVSCPLFYMAVPPGMFDAVTRGIAHIRCGPHARLVIEKPFGRNLASEIGRAHV